MGRNGRKQHKVPLLSLSKIIKSKGKLDFGEMFREFMEYESRRYHQSLAYGYGEVDLFGGGWGVDADYNDLWCEFGQGNKFNHNHRHVSHRYPQNSVGNRAIVKKYLGNHTHTKATQKQLWEQGFVPTNISDAEVIEDTTSSSLINSHFEDDIKIGDPIKIYYYRDYTTPYDVEEFTNLVEFDQFVQDMGITITEDVCQQILQSDEIHCSIDPYYWYKTGEQYLMCESSYNNLEWECRDRAAVLDDSMELGVSNPMYSRSDCFWD